MRIARPLLWTFCCLSLLLASGVHGTTTLTPSCTGNLRVCRDGEEHLQIINGVEVEVCTVNHLERKTVRILPQNWFSTVFNSWIAQIILEEVMQIPTEISVDPLDGTNVDFFHVNGPDSVMPASAYPWAALEQGASNPSCSSQPIPGSSSGGGSVQPPPQCGHVLTEVWADNENDLSARVRQKVAEDGGALGFLAGIGIFASSFAIEAHPALVSYRGLQRSELARVFQRPLRFREHCAALLPPPGSAAAAAVPLSSSFCAYFYSTFFRQPSAAGGAREVLPQFASSVAAMEQSFFARAAPPDLAAHMASEGRSFPSPLYGGNTTVQLGGADGTTPVGHFVNPACDWGAWPSLLIRHLSLKLVYGIYSYDDMIQIMDMAGHLRRPILTYWWQPEAAMERWKIDGPAYKLEKISFPPYSSDCRRRIPLLDQRCNGSDSNHELFTDPLAACDYPVEAPGKAFASSLRSWSPFAYALFKSMEITADTQNQLLAQQSHSAEYAANYSVASVRDRAIACDWVRGNRLQGAQWQQWVPPEALHTSCPTTASGGGSGSSGSGIIGGGIGGGGISCSGHGNCTAIPGVRIAGRCVCFAGWDGRSCDRCASGHTPANGGLTCKPLVYHDRSAVVIAIPAALACCGLAAIAAFARMVAANAHLNIIKFAQRLFLNIILAGAAVAMAAILSMLPPPSAATCLLQPWLGHVAYAAVLGSLYAKTWRVAKIFDNAAMKSVIITNQSLLLKVVAIVAVVVLFLTVWSIADPPTPTTLRLEAPAHVDVITVCRSQQPAWALVLLAIELLFLLWGVQLALMVRNLHSAFNEAKYIALAIYNILLISVLVVALSYALPLFPDTALLLTSLGTFFGTAVVVGLLFLPKFLAIRSGEAAARSKGTSSLHGAGTTGGGGGTQQGAGGGTTAGSGGELPRLRGEVARLNGLVSDLRTRLAAYEQQPTATPTAAAAAAAGGRGGVGGGGGSGAAPSLPGAVNG